VTLLRRRAVLAGLLAAPMIVRPGLLMPVRRVVLPAGVVTGFAHRDLFKGGGRDDVDQNDWLAGSRYPNVLVSSGWRVMWS
jgi:hypothetical protein